MTACLLGLGRSRRGCREGTDPRPLVIRTCALLVAVSAGCRLRRWRPARHERRADRDRAETGRTPNHRTDPYNAATDPNARLGRPGQYVSKVNFRDARVPRSDPQEPANGGAIETFAATDDAKRWYDVTSSFAQTLSGEYVYRDGKRVLRLSSDLTPAQAAE
jgi:hypothetical protein